MKILIISRTPWNEGNSFGNTFTNLFKGMQNVEIYHICCQKGITKGTLAVGTLQMTEKQIIRDGKNIGEMVFDSINLDLKESINKSVKNKYKDYIVSKRFVSALLVRDIIWKLSNYKKSDQLLRFIKNANPDIIYLPIYNSWYMCDIQEFVLEQCEVPVVGHITDDVYSYPTGYLASPMVYFYKYILRNKLDRLISKCSYLEVFAENMKSEYEKIFKKKCYLIGKGIKVAQVQKPCMYKEKQIFRRYVYTGNLGSGRLEVLFKLASCLDKIEAILEVYSTSVLSERQKKEMEKYKSFKMMGAIGSDEVKDVQQHADVLVHVESFNPKSICETKMSLSTKIIDYLCVEKLILAIGPEKINSIQFIKNNELGIVVSNLKELESAVVRISNGYVDLNKIQQKIFNYLITNRDILKIQAEIYDRLEKVLE